LVFDNEVFYNHLTQIGKENKLLADSLKNQLTETENNKKKLDEYEEIKLPVIIISAGLLILFIIFLILYINKAIQLKRINFKIENYESSYQENKELIENYHKENLELKDRVLRTKKEIEKLQKESRDKINILKSDLDNCINENKLLQKRMNELLSEKEKEHSERKSFEDENIKLKEKNLLLEQNLKKAKNKLEKEIDTRKNIETELRQMLDQLKGL
jgi:hypothetical protein